MKTVVQQGERLALGLVVLAVLVAPASASMFLAMDHGELVAKSDAVIEGRVVSVESSWDVTGSVIVSEAVIQVSETVIGEGGYRLRVQTFGGKVDDYEVVAHGFPRFERGEEVLLFLNRREALDRSLRVTGHQLGHYRIVDRDGTKVAEPALEQDVTLVGRGQQRVTPPQALSLEELKSRIRDLAASR